MSSHPLNITTLIANPRSRASKRATSPSIDLDNSLKTAPRSNDSLLAARPGAGISKKKSRRGNAKTRSQKIRQEKGLQRAEAVMDQLQKRVEGARQREGRRRERRKVWEEVNNGVDGAFKRATWKFSAIEMVGDGEGEGEGQWEVVVEEEEEEEEEEELDADQNGDREMGGVNGAEAPADGGVGATESTVSMEPVVAGGRGENLVVVDHATGLNGVEFEDEIT